MLKALERSVFAIDQRLVLVAPRHVTGLIGDHFANITYDSSARERFVREMQVLRGTVYLQEGNLKADDLSADGRHETAEDARSWHILWRDPAGAVSSTKTRLLCMTCASVIVRWHRAMNGRSPCARPSNPSLLAPAGKVCVTPKWAGGRSRRPAAARRRDWCWPSPLMACVAISVEPSASRRQTSSIHPHRSCGGLAEPTLR